MDYERHLRRLLQLRWFVLVAIVIAGFAGLSTRYEINVGDRTMERKVERFAVAQTQLLIDSPRSPITDASLNLSPLSSRATVYAAFLTNEEARSPILKASRLPADAPVQILGGEQKGPAAAGANPREGSATLGGLEPSALAILFAAEKGLPILNVRAQAASVGDAERLAEGAAMGAQNYLNGLETSRSTPRQDRVEVRSLGDATGGLVEEGPDSRAIVSTTVGVALALCLLLLVIDGAIRFVRSLRPSGPEPDAAPAEPQVSVSSRP